MDIRLYLSFAKTRAVALDAFSPCHARASESAIPSRHSSSRPTQVIVVIVSKTSRLRIAASLAVRWTFSRMVSDV